MSTHVADRDVDVMEQRSRDARQGRRVRALMLVAAVLYVGVLLLAPLGGIVWSALKGGFGVVAHTLSQSDVVHAFVLTAIITLVTVAVTSVFGVAVAIVLARDQFPGKRLLSALVDLPLAVSPIIVGLMAVLLFGNGGWFEPWFTAHGIQIIGALPSMVLVTIFVSIPFVIREVVPVLEELVDAAAFLVLADLAHVEAERHVVADGHVPEQRIVLEHESHAAVLHARVRLVLAGQRDPPGRGQLQPRDHAQHRALAGAARPQQRRDGAVRGLERHVVDRGERSEHLAEPFDHDRLGRHSVASFSRRFFEISMATSVPTEISARTRATT